MTPERWKKIDDLVQMALDLKPEVRPAFLDSKCRGDPDLRREVESLIAYQEDESSFLESPAIKDAAALMVDTQSAVMEGRTVSHSNLTRKIGEGGMGEVYLAHDTGLDRKVAFKLLPPSFTADPELRARFLREAQLASALDHPNICTIHEVGQSSGHMFIAMQYVEGVNLKQLIATRPLKLDTLLSISLQAADALAAAHDQGIIHRDIKPDNIIVTPKGQAKVLDFGLAKARSGLADMSGAESELTSRLNRHRSKFKPMDRAYGWRLALPS